MNLSNRKKLKRGGLEIAKRKENKGTEKRQTKRGTRFPLADLHVRAVWTDREGFCLHP